MGIICDLFYLMYNKGADTILFSPKNRFYYFVRRKSTG